jgi:uncharacterized membrane protein YbhN (UPF0104 family)
MEPARSALPPSTDAAEAVAEPRARRRAWEWLKKLAPWGVAAAILAYLFSEVPIAEAWRAARESRLEVFLSAMLGAVLLWFLLESAVFAYLFSRFNAPLSWAEARSLRGMTYLATPINWNLGTAAIILHLRRSKKIGAIESTSSMLFYQTIDGMVLAGLVLIGVWQFADSPQIVSLLRITIGFECFQVATLAVLMTNVPGWRWLRRVRGLGIFRTHRMATLRDIAALVVFKSLYFSVFVGVFWFGSHAFGVDVPLRLAMAATPAILLAGAIPITPAGLGTQQAAMIYFFSAYGDEAAILAFGLAFPVALVLSRCLLGLRYLRELPKLQRG